MAPVNPSDHENLLIGFKVGVDEYNVFQIFKWGVQSRQKVTMTAGKPMCTCPIFPMQGKCEHVTTVTGSPALIVNKDGKRPVNLVHQSLVEGTVTPKQSLVIYLQKTSKVALPSYDIGDLSAYNLVWLTTQGTTEQIKNATGTFDPEKIYNELTLALSKECKLHLVVSGTSVSAEKEEFSKITNPITPPTLPVAPARPKPLWDTVKRPAPEEFYVEKDTWVQIIYGMSEGCNILLTGSSGCGKSELAYIAAKAVGKQLTAFNMGAMSEPRSSLIGNVHFNKEDGTKFYKSRFVEAVEDVKNEGHCILLDEITRADRAAFNILLPLLDRQGYLSLDESEENMVITKNPKTCFISTANIGLEYSGTEALDVALKNRFGIIIDVDFPPKDSEVKVLMGRCPGLKQSMALRLVNIATEQRKLANDGDFVEKLSTRQLIETGKQIGLGIDATIAIKFCLESAFSSEGGDSSQRVMFRQICQKF